MAERITVEVLVDATADMAWQCFTQPEHIMQWNHASDDWRCPRAENDLRVGGRFVSRMEAVDGSEGFDFSGVYTAVVPHERIAYTMDDGRTAEVTFAVEGAGTCVVTVFDAERENPPELQRAGWQAILDNFKKHTEAA
ncbi:polyketide cyclase [Candidatus Kaiserbacteria bacterium]|nr:polyketide cyclase [Candidatus Kaiserbacteria bacterium]